MPYTNKEKQREYQRKWCAKNKNKLSIKKKELRNTPRGRAMALNRGCRSRSKTKGLDYSLDILWIEQEIEKGCAVTGHTFNLKTDNHMVIFVPSLDRIDPSKGYTKHNTQVVCFGVNALKGGNSSEDMYRLAEMITNPL